MKWIGWIMKRLCFSKYVFLFFFTLSSLFASVDDKSAILYYGKEISYPMVGIHDYIIVDANKTQTFTHGFDIYKDKMYAHIYLDKIIQAKEQLKIFIKKGFTNFSFDIKEKGINRVDFIQKFHEQHPLFKLIINAKFANLEKLRDSVRAILIEENSKIREKKIATLQSYGLDLIYVKYVPLNSLNDSDDAIKKIKKSGMIPYISTSALNIYGKSSKNAVKREVLTLIDESTVDRMHLSAHQHGALVFEYLGYIQKLYDINKGLPDVDTLGHYAGVVIWLNYNYESPGKLVEWVLRLKAKGIKVVFASIFGASLSAMDFKQLNIDVYDGDNNAKKTIIQKDSMIGYEIEPSLSDESLFLQPKNAKPLLTYEDKNGLKSVPAAITSWGGYATLEAFMLELNDENIWVINPFKFFAKALRLKKIPVPDPTTENGNRLLFSHVDGDGIMNYVESNPELVSGDMLLNNIFSKYKIPLSVSIIGAEIAADGLFPKLSPRLIQLSKRIYALDNVEPASHTFTHPFIWDKIKNGDLDKRYRLKPKGYKFSLQRELDGNLAYITKTTHPKRAAQTLYWSGDCKPTQAVLEYVYKHHLLNINGGYTVISNASPWLTNVSPLGLERGEVYQIYTGAQNENVYTNDWLGPFWGFKKVVQTFKLTNSPKRFKPIDIYYHLYSGSKTASLNALKYVYNWAIAQDVMPIYTSEYIPKVMDYYTVSISNDASSWLVSGMKDLKTLRVENNSTNVDLKASKTTLGIKRFETHTYISLDEHTEHKIKISDKKGKDSSYLISANAKVLDYRNGLKNKQYKFSGYVALQLHFHLTKECKIESIPKASSIKKSGEDFYLEYLKEKKAIINVICR